ncbi:hypothetical protein, partial [Enterococcus faecalis]|uniref:hypothetical protein n=1 Tax=Enterococcus faecalis TaxID=1351 RepID=UPI0031741AA3
TSKSTKPTKSGAIINEIKLSIMFTPPFGAVAKTSISQEEFLVGVVRACPDRLQGAILTKIP